MKKTCVWISTAVLLLLQSCESDLIAPRKNEQEVNAQSASGTQSQSSANTYFISVAGNDSGDGSVTKPFKTLKYAVSKVPANQGYVLQLYEGTFVESGLIEVPLGVSIVGAGIDKTTLKAASSFHHNPASPGYSLDKFLIRLNGSTTSNGNQTLSGFTIDGDGKKLHGGIYVRNRNNITIDQVKIKFTNFTGIWLWDVKDTKLKNSIIINSSWGNTGYCSGALNVGNLERVEIDNLIVDESTGYGIKAIGPSGNNNIIGLKIHDSRISVHPHGLWNGGSAPNIAIELWQVNLVGSEIYNTYVDNTISLVNSNATPSTGVQTIRVHHNTIDMETRANGAGYGIELTVHDAEIDHNYFIKGTNGIANWDHAMKNWSIHHNTFYALQGTYPGEIVRSQKNGLNNVKLYNNTIEFTGTKTMNVVGLYGGSSSNVDIKNNLIINSNTGYSYYPNKLIHMENGATVGSLSVKNNLFSGLPTSSVSGTYQNNLSVDPQITKSGNRPDAYYMPKAGSPLINAGQNVGYPFTGASPDIGAFEYTSTASSNSLPQISITSPANNTTLAIGTPFTVTVNASDNDGTVTKVEFFLNGIKLGEDATSPYELNWKASAGSSIITVKATDNAGGTGIKDVTIVGGSSTPININLDSSDAVLSGKVINGYDAQASRASYFYAPEGSGKNYAVPPPGAATFNFQLPKSGSYVIWAKVKASTASNQRYYIYNGSGKWFAWKTGIHQEWHWVQVTEGASQAIFNFQQGSNQFKMAWFDENVKVDQVLITNDFKAAP